MKRVCACLGIVVLTWACNDSRLLPAAPTSTSSSSSSTAADAPFPPPAPPGTTRALAGIVRSGGNIPMVIRLGEAIPGQIGDTECAGLGYGGWYGQRAPCQRFAVTVPTSGTLEVTVSAAMSDFDIDIVTSDGMFAAYDGYPYPSGSPRVQIPVSAGSTYQIRLAGARREFELTTALR